MVMSWIWTGLVTFSVVATLLLGNGSALSAAVQQGAQAGVTLAISMAGSICLWCGAGKLMEQTGITDMLSRLLRPVLRFLFTHSRTDKQLSGYLSSNICANFLGLGNAATPMGILAAKRLCNYTQNGVASNELCRLIVLNTASIQLIPANVAAVRVANGCATPFDILPAVWVTSILSVIMGLTAAFLLGKVWRR